MANLVTAAVIPSGGSKTQTIFSDGLTVVGVAIPTLSSVADVTFLVSSDGGKTFQTFDTQALQPFKFTNLTAGNCYWALDPNVATGIETFQIQTIDHVANTAVTQTPGVTFTVHFREFR